MDLSARPVLSSPIGDGAERHFQSDGDFAMPHAFIANAFAANRRSDRLLTRIQLAIAATGVLWVVVPAICMALAGGTPA